MQSTCWCAEALVKILPTSGGVLPLSWEYTHQSVSTRDGTVHIFHEDSPDKLTEVEALKTEFGTGTIGLHSKTHNLFLTTADFGPVPPAPTKKIRRRNGNRFLERFEH
jgi:hypothetical protein